MIKGLTELERLKVLRPMIGNCKFDEFGFPVIKCQSDLQVDWNKINVVNLQNAKARLDNKFKILLMFRYDKYLISLWNDPLKKIGLLSSYAAVATPDFSIYPQMNYNEIRHNIFMSRWLGCLWQNYGVTVYPTIGWGDESTFDMCFSAIEKGSIVIISTLGCLNNQEFFLKGYNEMLKRIQPRLIIVIGNVIPGMSGRILPFKYNDTFLENSVQPYLNGIDKIVSLEGGIA